MDTLHEDFRGSTKNGAGRGPLAKSLRAFGDIKTLARSLALVLIACTVPHAATAEASPAEVLAPASPLLVRTERYQPGTVVAELKYIPNYSQTGPTTAPASVEKESFVSVTLLQDGTFVVDNGSIRFSKALSVADFENLREKSAQLARANIKIETNAITCAAMPPPTRTRLAVAASDAAGTELSDDLGTVWLEEGCSYSLRLIHENPRELEVAAEVRAKVESIAHDLIDL